MEDGISGGGFVDERLNSGDGDGAFDIQARAFGAVIADVQHDARRKLTLNIEIPNLDVAEAVVGIDGEIVGDVSGRSRKAVLERERRGRGTDVGEGRGERRLEGEILNNGGVLREVVVDAVARAEDSLL